MSEPPKPPEPPSPPNPPDPRKVLAVCAVLAALATAACLYGNWLLAQSAELFATGMALILVVGGFIEWRNRKAHWFSALLLPGLLMVVPVVLYRMAWQREDEVFHVMVSVIRSIPAAKPDCTGIAQHPAVAAYAARIRSLSFENRQIVWRLYSLRRNEVYNCATQRVSRY